MQKIDITRLLGYLHAFDGRQIDELTANAWNEALKHIPDFNESIKDNITNHYRTSTSQLQIADINRFWKNQKNSSEFENSLKPIENKKSTKTTFYKNNELDYECSYCRANKGEPCVNKLTNESKRIPCSNRMKLAESK